MSAISFTVPGQPVPKARPRVYAGRTITDPRTVAYESLVRLHALRARQTAKRSGVAWALDADVFVVALTFYMPNRRRADVDNLAKGVLDAMNDVIYCDDSRVSSLHVRRGIDAAEPRAEVLVQACSVAAYELMLARGVA